MDTRSRQSDYRSGRRHSLFVASKHLRGSPKDEAARIIGRQFLRSGTSLAANYRAACRARSAADFISKISIVTEEADETLFWFELLVEAELSTIKLAEPLMSECAELLRIFAASLAT